MKIDVKQANQVICLMGPTAAGKTNLALQLVKKYPCDIISVDSALVYKGMDIGTAKPDAATLALAPHRLIDIREPHEPYSAADFCRDAHDEITDIFAQGRIPLLVGGTMLYFKALQQGLSPLPSADEEIRQTILEKAQQQGWQALHDELRSIDPVSAQRIHPNDPQRLSRALEVFYITGQSMTELCHARCEKSPFVMKNYAINPPSRAELHQRIEQRFHQMLEQGFVAEVEALYQRGDLNATMPAIRAVGYRQVWAYLEGEYRYDVMVERAIIATRQLAKRQMTWLRSWSDLEWLLQAS